MDSLTQLALMAKAQLVFATPGTFLSFPALQPLSYPPDQLDFSQLAARATPAYPEFCHLVDTIPQGVLYPPAAGPAFSDEYGKVLREAQTAQSALSAQQAAALQQALAFLYVKQPDGTLADSPSLVAYYQYQQAWLQAKQAYANAESTAETSADPAAQAQWQNVDEPRLRAAVQDALDAWTAKGDKAQVEQAQAAQQACAAASPALQWQDWQNAFSPDLDEQTAPDGSTYALAAYSPYDILAQDGWPTFTLTAAEITQLASQAPAELRNILDPGPGSPSVSSLSFEFCSVTVNRGWLHPAVFDARFWRFGDPSELLSDGGTPPKGECPGYISGLVFARNIVITDATATPSPPRPLPVFPPVVLHHPPVIPPILTRPPIVPEPINPGPVRLMAASATPATAPMLSSATAARLNLGTFRALPLDPILLPVTQASNPPPSPNVSILAFICAQLPRCPDPDPALTW